LRRSRVAFAKPERTLARRVGVHPLERVEGARLGRLLRQVGHRINLPPYALIYRAELLVVRSHARLENRHITSDGIVVGSPPLDFPFRDVRLAVVLRVSCAAIHE